MHRTTRRLVLTGSLCLLAATASGESGQVRFRVTVEEVLVDVVVTERNRPLAGLTAADFVLLDGGVRRDIRLVPLEDLPVSVLFVMDLSESVTRDRRQRLAAAARQFSGRLSENDRCAVMIFSSQPVLTHDFAGCSELPPNPFPEEGVIGGTALWDSLLLSTALAGEEPGRAVVIVFTDGDDSRSMGFGSEMSAGDAIEAARLTDAVVYAIGFEGNGARVNKRFLRRLTEETGGQALFPERTGDLIGSFARIEADMHAQYRLAYIPREAERDGEWREIEVSVRGRRDLLARTRNGYYAFPSEE